MSRDEVVSRAKAILAEAYEEAAMMIAVYLETHSEPLKTLCKEIDPENWMALESRVRRARERNTSNDAGSSASPTLSPVRIRDARSSIRKDAAAVVESLDEDTKKDLVKALVKSEEVPTHERKRREAIAREATTPLRQMAGSFTTMGIVSLIDQATEEVGELVSNGGMTSDYVAAIREAVARLEREIAFATELVVVSG